MGLVGILKKVEYTHWSTPVVPVPKRDGSFKICGYFKVTLNPVLEMDQHDIPKAGDSFANLARVNSIPFSICIMQAYQQWLLHEESAELVMMNTHLGLYRYNHLPFPENDGSATK